MAVCSFFLRGTCKFGDNCRNDHPQNARQGAGFGNTSWTNPRNPGTNAASKNANSSLSFSADSIKNDLTPLIDKPLWPLSSYAAAKHESTLLAGLDESPEELRVRAFMAQQAGNTAEYATYETNKISAAEQVHTNALNNSNEAYAQAVNLSSNANSSASANAVVGSISAFGNSALSSVFGGNATTSAFGAPAFGQSAFGQTSTAAATAQPVASFGQPQQPVSAFGQPQPQQTDSAFGQPQQASAFSQPSQTSSLIKPASGAFGNLTSTGSSNAFGGGGFSAFAGQPSAFGAGATVTTAPATGAFGSGAFGAPSTAATSTFGAPSAFGALAQKDAIPAFGAGSAFGSQENAPRNPFSSSNQTTSPFTPLPSTSLVAPEPQKIQPTFSSQPPSAYPMASPSTSMFGTPSPSAPSKATGPPDFSNAPSRYKPGTTPYDLNLPSDYEKHLPPEALEAFKSQRFEWGKVPDWIPPPGFR